MNTAASSPQAAGSADDFRPADQQAGPGPLQANPNDPVTEASAGTPQYGDFGRPEAAARPNYDGAPQPSASADGRDGSNDNPDEFSELRGTSLDPAQDRGARVGHAEQNQDPEAVRRAQDKDNDVQRAAWADDDRRYAGGKSEATWQENNDREHRNND